MTRSDILDTIQTMRAEGRAFCVATVVRTADLTSAKAGAKAVVTAEGEIIGHLGGGCVRGAVTRTAAEVLATGTARLISVRPSGQAGSEAGVEVHASGCPSGGTADIFIEPYLTAFRLQVIGDGPIARAVEAHAALMDLAVARGGPEGAPEADAIVIASQGSGDLAALRAALESRAGYVAMVASHRKAAVLKERLAAGGMDPARIERLISPAGLDLGAIDPHEIAVSILAELTAWRRRGRNGAPS